MSKEIIKKVYECTIRFYNFGEICASYARFTDEEMNEFDVARFVNETIDKHKEVADFGFRVYCNSFYTTDRWDIINANK